MRRRTGNPKRRIAREPIAAARLRDLAERVNYGGSPLHKRNPGDFGLSPPSSPRPGKTLCDGTGIFRRSEAQALLRVGIDRGFVSEQTRAGWPQNIWAVSDDGHVLEAQLDNQEIGSYHGYPLTPDDPFRDEVQSRWQR